MAKRISILVDDSLAPGDQLAAIVTHQIYRYTEPGSTPGPDAVPLIEFDEDKHPISICEMYEEVVKQDEYESNCFRTSRVLVDEIAVKLPDGTWTTERFPVTVKIDGVALAAGAFSFEGGTGRIWIVDRPVPYFYPNVVTVTYYYHSFVVKDREAPEPSIRFRGTVATGLFAPQTVSVAWDSASKAVRLSWAKNPKIGEYFYRSRMKDDKGHLSVWSDEQGIQLPNDGPIYYAVQRYDDAAWPLWSLSETLWCTDTQVPGPVGNPLAPTFTFRSNTHVSFSAPNPMMSPPVPRRSHAYRVTEQDDAGARAETWTESGTVDVVVPYSRMILRRKVHNGTPAAMEGPDAVTLLDVTGSLDANLIYEDSVLDNPGAFCYTTYLVDESDDISAHRSWVVDTINQTVTELGGTV